MLWRQGDVFIESTPLIPARAVQQQHLTLAEGEVTGHAHCVAEADAALLFEWRGELFLQVIGDRATVIHEEHGPISLGRGAYRVWKQREYNPRPGANGLIRPGSVAEWEWVTD